MSTITVEDFLALYKEEIRHRHNPFRRRYELCDTIMKRLYATYSSFSSEKVHIVHTNKLVVKDINYLLAHTRAHGYDKTSTVDKEEFLKLLQKGIKLVHTILSSTHNYTADITSLHKTWEKLAQMLDMV